MLKFLFRLEDWILPLYPVLPTTRIPSKGAQSGAPLQPSLFLQPLIQVQHPDAIELGTFGGHQRNLAAIG